MIFAVVGRVFEFFIAKIGEKFTPIGFYGF
jgi:hypothetical protein